MSNSDPYEANLKDAKWFAILARGSMAFRFGPIAACDVGKIMEQAVTEGMPISFVADMGPVIDWELARDLRGYPTVEKAFGETCRGCGKPLLKENAWMVDGCPCNSRKGCNDGNQIVSEWRAEEGNTLRHRVEQLEAELAKLRGEK